MLSIYRDLFAFMPSRSLGATLLLTVPNQCIIWVPAITWVPEAREDRPVMETLRHSITEGALAFGFPGRRT